MTAVLVGRHSTGELDGLVTAFAGELAPDMPTRILPLPDLTPTERLWLPWLDAVESLIPWPTAEPVDSPDAWEPLLDAVECFDESAEKLAAVEVATRAAPITVELLERVESGLRALLER